ncbi:LysR family transcriptional regulator [Kocuria atrinae]|uniref:LysR family transcriptional regulator n=1 Tax=Kocuria atrinae TaxID=592377 RepID=UPI00030E24AB|nr:LysR family transcriptional regulator [Kocuria atrinae]
MENSQLPDVRTLQVLEAIGRLQSITLAAGSLGITQQAASTRLKRLETRLGRSLVVRAARESRLTDDGQALVSMARPLLSAATDFESELSAYLSQKHAVNVAASLTIAEHFLPRWIVAYREAGNTASRVNVTSTNTREVIRLVSTEAVELGFIEGFAPPPGLQYAPLALDELIVLVAPSHPWAARGRVSARTLAATPLITREDGSGCRSVVVATLGQHGIPPEQVADPAMQLPSNTAVLEAAAANAGPAVLSTHPAASFLGAHRLVRIEVDGVRFRRSLGAIWRQGAEPPTPASQEFLRAVSRMTPLSGRQTEDGS